MLKTFQKNQKQIVVHFSCQKSSLCEYLRTIINSKEKNQEKDQIKVKYDVNTQTKSYCHAKMDERLSISKQIKNKGKLQIDWDERTSHHMQWKTEDELNVIIKTITTIFCEHNKIVKHWYLLFGFLFVFDFL